MEGRVEEDRTEGGIEDEDGRTGTPVLLGEVLSLGMAV